MASSLRVLALVPSATIGAQLPTAAGAHWSCLRWPGRLCPGVSLQLGLSPLLGLGLGLELGLGQALVRGLVRGLGRGLLAE